jgi:hypothetical protein
LLHINKSVKGEQIDNTKGPNEVIDKVFENIHKFSQENQDRMGDVGKLMQMQVNIDKLIENKRNGQPLDKDLSLAVKVQYEELCKEKLPTIEHEIFLNLYINKLKKIIDEIQEKKILFKKEQSLQNNE